MHFSCEKTVFHEAVSTCIHATSTKSSTQILEGLLIVAHDGGVSMSGFNYKIGIQKTFAASVFESGGIVIGARILSDIVRKMPGEIIELSCGEGLSLTVRSGQSEFQLAASAAADFPELPNVGRAGGFPISCALLKEMILGTVFSVSTNENKPIHTGALFELSENRLGIIAVDGYRLAIRREIIGHTTEQPISFVVPGETLRDLCRILPDDDEAICHIYPERKHALFEFSGTVVLTRLLEGEFLQYHSAIPIDQPISLEIERQEVIDAIERVSIIISERLKNPVCCVFEDQTLQLSCITALGRSFDTCTIPTCPERVEIGFNNRYLLDALRACPDEEVLFELKSSLSPCTIRPLSGDRFLYLVLPVRLKAGE